MLAATKQEPREEVIVTLQRRGMSQRMIALALGISRSAVRTQLERHARKLSAG